MINSILFLVVVITLILFKDTELLDFEVVPTDGLTASGDNAHFSLAELRLLVAQSARIALDRGIDDQDFRCAGCPTPLVVGSTTAGQ